jgi:hypothetical protein
MVYSILAEGEDRTNSFVVVKAGGLAKFKKPWFSSSRERWHH